MSEVLYDVEEHVATITINRPKQRNAIAFSTISSLRDAFARAGADRVVRVVVLQSVGDVAFCAGADLGGLRGDDSDVETAHAGRGHMAQLFTEMWRLEKPIIARIQGYALAGGFGLALACDLVVASDRAQFGAPEVNVGMWPFMISVPMARSMPPKVALDLILTARRVDAVEGQRLGFVSRIAQHEQLDAEVRELASLIASKSPAGIRLGRPSFYRMLDQNSAEALSSLQAMLSIATGTPDAAEGIAAFQQKRAPIWND